MTNFVGTAYNFDSALDALIVGIETQAEYLSKKKTWTRKIVLVTDGESPIEMETWQAVANKMNLFDVSLAIMCVRCSTMNSTCESCVQWRRF